MSDWYRVRKSISKWGGNYLVDYSFKIYRCDRKSRLSLCKICTTPRLPAPQLYQVTTTKKVTQTTNQTMPTLKIISMLNDTINNMKFVQVFPFTKWKHLKYKCEWKHINTSNGQLQLISVVNKSTTYIWILQWCQGIASFIYRYKIGLRYCEWMKSNEAFVLQMDNWSMWSSQPHISGFVNHHFNLLLMY